MSSDDDHATAALQRHEFIEELEKTQRVWAELDALTRQILQQLEDQEEQRGATKAQRAQLMPFGVPAEGPAGEAAGAGGVAPDARWGGAVATGPAASTAREQVQAAQKAQAAAEKEMVMAKAPSEKADVETLAREEAERQAQEAAKKAQEKAETLARGEAERQAQEESAKKAQEKAETLAREEAERQAQEEAAKKAQEAADAAEATEEYGRFQAGGTDVRPGGSGPAPSAGGAAAAGAATGGAGVQRPDEIQDPGAMPGDLRGRGRRQGRGGGGGRGASRAGVADAREREERRLAGHALRGTLEAQAAGDGAGQQVLAAQQAGRYLEAKRLLDAAGGDAPFGADAVRHIRETQSRVEEALELLKRAGECGGSDSGWSEKSGPGYRVLYKYDGSTGEVQVVSNITLDVEPLKLWTLIREFDLLPTWNASFQGVDLEASFASQCDFYHSQNKAIVRGFINPTESYIERTYVDALAEHGKLIMVGQCPQQSASQHCGLDIPPVPRKVNRVVATTCDVVTPMNEKQVMITSYRKMKTPLVHLPQWVVRQAASSLTNGNMKSFQKALESWDDSDFAERFRSGQRAEYYAQLMQQLVASTRG